VPALQVRDLPDHLYRKLVEKASADHRSIAQETVVLLEKARRMLIERILRTPPPADPHKILDPVDLLREDRGR